MQLIIMQLADADIAALCRSARACQQTVRACLSDHFWSLRLRQRCPLYYRQGLLLPYYRYYQLLQEVLAYRQVSVIDPAWCVSVMTASWTMRLCLLYPVAPFACLSSRWDNESYLCADVYICRIAADERHFCISMRQRSTHGGAVPVLGQLVTAVSLTDLDKKDYYTTEMTLQESYLALSHHLIIADDDLLSLLHEACSLGYCLINNSYLRLTAQPAADFATALAQ